MTTNAKRVLDVVQESLRREEPAYVGPYDKHPKRLLLALEWGLLGLCGDERRARSWAWLPFADRALACSLLFETALADLVPASERGELEAALQALGSLAPTYVPQRKRGAM